MKECIIIVAVDQKLQIGNKGDQLVYIKNDLKRFKEFTTGHTVVMGHNTQKCLPKGFLPNRRNIVLTRNKSLALDNVEVAHSVEEVLEMTRDDEKVYIIGGTAVYKLFFDIATRLEVTHIGWAFDEADSVFPEIKEEEWTVEEVSEEMVDEKSNLAYKYVAYIKKCD